MEAPLTVDVFLVLHGDGSLYASMLDGERADKRAQQIGGLLVPLTATDYRRHPGRSELFDPLAHQMPTLHIDPTA
jgi:hypothetical protein